MEFDRRGLVAVGIFALFCLAMVGYFAAVRPHPTATAVGPGVLLSPSPGASASASAAPATAGPSAKASPGPARTMAFLGDSWTLGEATPCTLQCSFAAVAAAQAGMTFHADAVSGTGYCNGGGPTTPGPDQFKTRLAHFETFSPDVAVIAGGQADEAWVQATVQKCASTLLTRAKAEMPHSAIVVVGPFAAGPPSAQALATRDSIASAASASGVTFIDPLAEQWITAANAAQYIGADGQNPTVEGHKYLADRLVADLRQLKVL